MKYGGGSITPGHIARCWIVRMPRGVDPVTGEVRKVHQKTLHGTKGGCQSYIDWYAGLVAAGYAPLETVSRSELRKLADLQLKAAEFRGELVRRIAGGAKAEPGELSLFGL